ncbi:MAG: multidrug efflux protein [Symbiobacteriaceae bacterium]|jgi:MFS family permease|nr:multidrug efflux protein [Symbiobacteriaceae bacterium]
MRQRWLSFLLVWSSFYEQLAWSPVLVLIAAGLGDPAATALAASAYSLANLVGNLVFGLLADRVARHRVAGAGLVGMAGTAMLHLFASSPMQLIGVRFLHGLAAAAVAPAALAGVTDAAPGQRRGEAMARVGLIIAFASMVAPPVTGRLARGWGVAPAVMMLGACLAAVGVVALAFGGERAAGGVAAAGAVAVGGDSGPGRASGRPSAGPLASNADSRLNPTLAAVGATVAFAIMFGQNVLFYAMPLRGTELGMSSAQVGGLLSAFAVGALVAFVPPLSRSADRWGRVPPLLAGLGLTSLGLFWLSAATGAPQIAAGLAVYGLGFGLAFPSVTALSGDAAGQGRRGFAFGLLTAAFSAGAIVGPLATRALEGLLPPFTVAGLVAMAGAGAALAALRQPRTAAPPIGPGA